MVALNKNPDNQSEYVINATGLSKSYGNLLAVDAIDLKIKSGECFGFLGPNGAGKTTTMRILYLASPVSRGTLHIFGCDVSQVDCHHQIKAKLGVVPQEDSLDQDLTAAENLDVFCRFYGLSGARLRTRTQELLDFVNLREKADVIVSKLSGGMKRRLLVARGLIGEPKILILDEPTTGLDPQARHDLWERVRELKRHGTTVLLTTHYMDEAEQLCDRLVIMDHGKIVVEGSPRDLIAQNLPPSVVEINTHDIADAQRVKDLTKNAVDPVVTLSDRILVYTRHPEELLSCIDLGQRQVFVRRTTLEDVFLKITGRRFAEQGVV